MNLPSQSSPTLASFQSLFPSSLLSSIYSTFSFYPLDTTSSAAYPCPSSSPVLSLPSLLMEAFSTKSSRNLIPLPKKSLPSQWQVRIYLEWIFFQSSTSLKWISSGRSMDWLLKDKIIFTSKYLVWILGKSIRSLVDSLVEEKNHESRSPWIIEYFQRLGNLLPFEEGVLSLYGVRGLEVGEGDGSQSENSEGLGKEAGLPCSF